MEQTSKVWEVSKMTFCSFKIWFVNWIIFMVQCLPHAGYNYLCAGHEEHHKKD